MERKKFYDNVVTVPATKTAGSVTYTSNAYSDFIASAFGGAKILFGATDVSKITDNFTVVPQISYDGSNYYDLITYTDLLSSAGSAAVAEVDSLTVTAACSSNGDLTVTLPGLAAVTVAVATAASTAANVATLIRNATYTGWTTGGSSAIVTFTCNTAGDASGAPTLGVASTGVTGTFSVSTQGANADYDIGFTKEITIAPYLKVKLVSDATGALASGHGVNVDALLLETEEKYRRKIFADVLPVTSLDAGFVDQYSTIVDLGSGNIAYKMYVCMYIADRSKVTDTIRYIVETSTDGSTWTTCSAAATDVANGSGLAHSQTLVTNGSTYDLGRYFRVKMYRNSNDVDAAIAASSGLKFNLIFLY